MTAITRRLRLRPGHQFPRHTHDRWSFGLPISGSVRLWTAGSWYTVVSGAATVLPPGEVHHGVASELHGLEYMAVSVSVDLVDDVLDLERIPAFAGVLCPTGPVSRLLAAVQDAVPEESRERIASALWYIFSDDRAAISHVSEQNIACAAKRLIDANFLHRVRVKGLAECLGVAPGTLIRSFQRRHGLSPYAYVVSRRVDHARQLLESGSTPDVAAHRAGFYDQAHLNRHFVRLVGVTPGAYRRA